MSSDEKNSLLPIVPDIISLNGEDSKYKKKVFHDIDEYRSFNIKESEKETEDYPADDESIFYHKRPHRDSVADLKVERIKEVRGDDEELVKGQEREEKNSASNVMNEDMITEEPTKPQIHIHYINSPQQEQLRQQWSSLSPEKKEGYLPPIPLIIPVTSEHISHIAQIQKDINLYRTYNIKENPQEMDSTPPDDTFIIKTLFKRPQRPTQQIESANSANHIRVFMKKDTITTVQVYLLGGLSSDRLICSLRRSDSLVLAQKSFSRVDGSILTMVKQPYNTYMNCQVFSTNGGTSNSME